MNNLFDNIKNLLESESFSYVWDFLKILIATLMGYSITRWSAKSDQKKIEKKFKKEMLEFFNALRKSDIFSLFRIISTIDESRFLEVIDGYMKSFYIPEKMTTSGSIKGSTQTSKNFNFKIRNEQYIMTNNYQNLQARIDVYGYIILLIPVGGSCIILDMEKSNGKYNLFHQDQNVDTLIGFLIYLEKQYHKHRIIRKKKSLDKTVIINPRWKDNLHKKPRSLPKEDDESTDSTDNNSNEEKDSNENKDSNDDKDINNKPKDDLSKDEPTNNR